MKKITLLLMAVLFSYGYSSAQFSNGTICVGGIIDYQSTKGETTTSGGGVSVTTDNPENTILGIIPRGMYFLNEKLAVGLGLGITNQKTLTVAPGFSETESKTSVFSIMPGARYILAGNERAGIGGEAVIAFSLSGKTETETSFVSGAPTTKTDTDLSVFGIAVSPYFYLFLTDRIALESSFGHIGYGSVKTETGGAAGAPKTEVTNNGLSINLNPLNSLTFGVAFYFGQPE